MLTCRLLGHRYRFEADGAVMRWTCKRACGAGGQKSYDSAESAARYAAALDRDPLDDLGRRGPLIGLAPLRIGRWIRQRHRRRSQRRSLQPR